VSAIFGDEIPYCIKSGGVFIATGGTSAAAPVVASIIALLNDIRIGKNQPVLGYINPWLFGLQRFGGRIALSAFHDITVGSNPGSQSTKGFPASAGWDGCSGMGSLNYSALAAIISNEANPGICAS